MSIIPKNEAIRKAVKWISEQRQSHPDMPLAQLINQVTLRFDLNPNDSQFLINFYKEHKDAPPED